ncbi:MAG TPA: DUF3376 domain-containing protein, partial [Candidatus Sulfopaludibacter sp.]|nr:DUF3376 domain-containing protein [Candidatus Sulfopaludibacter sp.]
WNLLNHYFKLYEILEWAMKDSLDRADFGWRSLAGTADQLDGVFDEERREAILGPISAAQWSQVQGTLSAMLDTAGIEMPVLPDSAARARFYDALKARRGKPPLPAIEGNLLHALDRSFAEALGNLPADRAGNLLRGEYVRFLDLDRLVFPLRFGAQFESTEPIRVVRFSPLDAQRGLCRGAVADKVCGRALGNFGGFFKKSWRANDIMIGRMDAVCQLIEGLLTRERLANFGPPADLTAARIRGFFATLGDGQAQQLADELNFFLAHPAAYTRDRWDALLDALVGAAHGDILAEEWPRVFDCAIQQEYQWGQYRTNEAPPPQPYDPEHLAWTRARKRPDRVLVAVAGEAIRSRRLPEFQPGQIAGHPFSEEIPEPILTELGLLGAIRASRSLVGSLPKERQEGVTKNLFYRRLFSQLLPFAYWWAAIRRRNPDSVIVLNTIGITAGIAVFLVGFLLFLNPFGWHMSWKVWAVTMGAPAASFLIWILVFGWRGHRHSLRQ